MLHYTDPVSATAILLAERACRVSMSVDGHKGGSMRAFSGASLASAAMVALSISAGCSQVSQVQAKRSFKAANIAYQAQDYKKAVELYEDTLQKDPTIATAHFFLGNSMDNQYKPSRRGEAANDELMTKAVENYKLCAEKLAGSAIEDERKLAKLSLEYLVAAYGVDKLNDAASAEPVLIKMIEMEPSEPSNYAVLGKIYEDAGYYDDAEKVLLMSRTAKPKDASVYLQLAGFYNRQGRFDKTIEALNQRAEQVTRTAFERSARKSGSR